MNLARSTRNDKLFYFTTMQCGNTPLHVAAKYGHCAVAKELLEAGADRCIVNEVRRHSAIPQRDSSVHETP